ncbi:MAG: hypothetical protein MJZ37_00935 [Bacilli bacterium]|nr:hypothetical protein [Bacilli bacterium]
MDSMEIREKIRKDKDCRSYVEWCLACFLIGPQKGWKLPGRRHKRKAAKKLDDYMNLAWLIENKVEKYVREEKQ